MLRKTPDFAQCTASQWSTLGGSIYSQWRRNRSHEQTTLVWFISRALMPRCSILYHGFFMNRKTKKYVMQAVQRDLTFRARELQRDIQQNWNANSSNSPCHWRQQACAVNTYRKDVDTRAHAFLLDYISSNNSSFKIMEWSIHVCFFGSIESTANVHHATNDRRHVFFSHSRIWFLISSSDNVVLLFLRHTVLSPTDSVAYSALLSTVESMI